MDAVLENMAIQLAAIVISVVSTVVGVYVKKWLASSTLANEYGLYNDKVERVLENAILYAEGAAKTIVADSITKRELAIDYVKLVSPDMIEREGLKLEAMIDRKVVQVIK